MLVGAMVRYSMAVYRGNPWLGLLLAMLLRGHYWRCCTASSPFTFRPIRWSVVSPSLFWARA